MDNQKSKQSTLESSQLMELFEDQLKDIHWAEKVLLKALPKMIENASSEKLIDALENHLAETENHIDRIEKVFAFIDKKASTKKCDAMQGLIEEAKEIMESCEEGPMCDAGIIVASQKIEHYEIATYGTLVRFAKTLGLSEASTLLETTLKEEKAADKKLTEIAVATINTDAAQKTK